MDRSRVFRKAALDRLSSPDQFDQVLRVTSPRSWVALAALLMALLLLAGWGVFGRVTTRLAVSGVLVAQDEGRAGSLAAQVRLTPEEAARVRPGMRAHIAPTSWRPQEDGYLVGTVEQPLGGAAPADAKVTFSIRLQREPDPGGRYVSTSRPVDASGWPYGLPVAGSIAVAERRPAVVAFPALGRLWADRAEVP